VTILPLTWLATVTFTAGWEKIFSDDPKLGFLSHARMLTGTLSSGALPSGVQSSGDVRHLIFNDYVDAVVAAFFLVSVVVIVAASAHEWFSVLSGRKIARTTETPFERAPRAA
jgi:carbon starvation protein